MLKKVEPRDGEPKKRPPPETNSGEVKTTRGFFGQKKILVRRLIPLLMLATGITLVVVHFTKILSHEIILQIGLSEKLSAGMTGLKLQVTGPNRQDDNAAYVVFRISPSRQGNSAYQHALHLVSGTYRLSFQCDRDGNEPIMVERDLDVTTDAVVRIQLP